MEKIKTFIIDDEEHAQMLLEKYLEGIEEINIVGKYNNGFDAVRAIQKDKPELIFLDIQMPKLNGFEVLDLLDEYPIIIFSTAYDEFAIKAFEFGAADYLLKPYSRERLVDAVKRAKEKLNNNDNSSKSVVDFVKENEEIINRVAVKSRSKINIIPTSDIHYIEAQDDYVMIYSSGGEYLKESTMKYFEKHLNPEEFVRVHRSYIVRIDQISRVENYEKNSHVIILKSKAEIKVSRSGYDKLKEALKL